MNNNLYSPYRAHRRRGVNTSLVGLIALLAVIPLVGCGDDSSDSTDPDAGEPPVSENAYLVLTRVLDPSGRNAYVSILPDLEPAEVDLGQALEFSGRARAFAHEGDVMIMNSETGEITRYDVDERLNLIEGETLSMTGLGITRFISAFIFISPTRAYYVDSNTLQLVVWNPQTMELVSNFSIAEIERPGFTIAVRRPRLSGDRVLVPIAWSNSSNLRPSVGLLILDAQSDQVISVLEDERCTISGGSFVDDQGEPLSDHEAVAVELTIAPL
ncbi:MAG: hypothetical protein AAGC55_32905 [Myxococcota bacterium]